MSKITGEIARHNIDILSIVGANDANIERFVLTIFCGFAKADCKVEQIVAELSGFPFVTKVEYLDAKGRLFDRFHFPIKIMNKHRAILVRVDPLLRVQKHLQEQLGSAGESIMFTEGKSYAQETWLQYMKSIPNAKHEEILENVKDGLRATGWGLFEFQETQNAFQVTIKNPPTLDGNGSFHSRFLYGVTASVTEALYGFKVKVDSANYDKQSDTLTLTFEKLKK
jgi:hypothetical protein